MKHKTKTILLPTQDLTNIAIFPRYNDRLLLFGTVENSYKNEVKFQHLYLISDDEIKQGDWVNCKQHIFQVTSKEEINNLQNWCRKIIATTNKSLNLPEVSQSFIKKYIEEYNKIITKRKNNGTRI